MSLFRKIFWLALFVVATFCFIVLFEKGPANFTANLRKQFDAASAYVQEKIK